MSEPTNMPTTSTGEAPPAARSSRKLVPDIKPTPSKERSDLGVVEITLDQHNTVKAVGVVYGIEHQITGQGYRATLFLDQYNQRIRIIDYEVEDQQAFVLHVRFLAEANGFDKIICMARGDDWQGFLKYGYVLEAVLKHFHAGDDAFIVSKFRSQERLTSSSMMDEILLIEQLMGDPVEDQRTPVPDGHAIRLARAEDIPELVALYQEIFETYPSPLIHASYLQTVFEDDSLFAVCTHGGKIIAAASAEMHHSKRAAELTDCATLKASRGRGLMAQILKFLEAELDRRDFICAYTMARARSYGMNNVFYQLGYRFMGRLVNNCDIYGAYEDMNIWVRDLRLGPRDSESAEPEK